MRKSTVIGATFAMGVCVYIGWLANFPFTRQLPARYAPPMGTFAPPSAQAPFGTPVPPGSFMKEEGDPEVPDIVYDGLTLAALHTKQNDESHILQSVFGMHIQKFVMKVTKKREPIFYELELHEKGKPVQTLTSLPDFAFTSRYNVVLLPLNKDSSPSQQGFDRCDRIKFSVVLEDGPQLYQILDNPLKGTSVSPSRGFLEGANPESIPLLTGQTTLDKSHYMYRSLHFRVKVGNFPSRRENAQIDPPDAPSAFEADSPPIPAKP